MYMHRGEANGPARFVRLGPLHRFTPGRMETPSLTSECTDHDVNASRLHPAGGPEKMHRSHQNYTTEELLST